MRILIAGEVNPDLILENYRTFPQLGEEVLVDDLLLTVGGSSAICAVGLARLGDRVTFAANVGADTYGDLCIGWLEREGIDVSLVNRRTDLKTGITVSITSSKDRALVTYPGSIATLRAEDLPKGVFAGYRHFHISGYFLQDGLRPGVKGLFAEAKRAGLSTSLDTGWDPSGEWPDELIDTLREVDVFLPNESEIQAIAKRRDVVESLRALDNGHTLTIGKLGKEGCIALHRGMPMRVEAFAVQVVDTTGAGDSFDAGFLHAWLKSRPLGECMALGAACGSLSTRGLGGTATQPSEEEAERFMHAQAGD